MIPLVGIHFSNLNWSYISNKSSFFSVGFLFSFLTSSVKTDVRNSQCGQVLNEPKRSDFNTAL